MNCPSRLCGAPVAFHWPVCPACGSPLGYPNVRAAEAERAELGVRYNEVVGSVCPQVAAVLNRFEEQVRTQSRAVMCRGVVTQLSLIQSGDGPFQTFFAQVTRGRIPLENEFDPYRTSVESLFFPHYFMRIHFAALSLDGAGLASYGGGQPVCHLAFRSERIRDQASLFRENVVLYCRRTGQVVTEPVPAGGRACWEDRGRLAVVKCGAEARAEMADPEFPALLQRPGPDTSQDVFVEVHIHEPLVLEDVGDARFANVPTEAEAGASEVAREDRTAALLLRARLEEHSVTVRGMC